MRVLVTGFGPFPGQPRNATAEMVRGLTVPGVDIRSVVLPVAWHKAPELALREARDFGATLVIMSGVAAPSGVLKVECGATTSTGKRADVDGTIIEAPEGSPVVMMSFDVRAAVRAARRAIRDRAPVFGNVLKGARLAPVRKTNDYLCNHLAYHVALANVAPCGFLHWPSDLTPDQIPAARQVLSLTILSQLR
jgi:pyroglutamyl-peptidase